ncbi:hypothetical protein SDJN03_04690, partial [Cucurbita argyrosperma subsp. sororia]
MKIDRTKMQEHMKIRSEYSERRMKCMHRSQPEEEEGREEKRRNLAGKIIILAKSWTTSVGAGAGVGAGYEGEREDVEEGQVIILESLGPKS